MARSRESDRVVERGGFKYIRNRAGNLLTFWDCVAQARRGSGALGTGIARALETASDEWDLERIEAMIDDLETYSAHIRGEIEKRRGVRSVRERIELLRNVEGREPGEAAAFLAKADELERRLESR